jgi:hemin uptake protein HemP
MQVAPYTPVEPTRKDRVPSDRSEAALYGYVNITITHNNSVYYLKSTRVNAPGKQKDVEPVSSELFQILNYFYNL